MTHSAIQVRQAVILAGGNATRLRPYTDRVPKALVDVGGKPILDHQLAWLAAEGIEHAVVSCGYRADALQRHLLGRTLPLEVTVVVEERRLGRGGGLKHAARALPMAAEPWLALNGDVVTRFSLAGLADRHADSGAAATLGIAALRSPYGIVDVGPDGRIQGFDAAPVLPHRVNAGVHLFAPETTALLPDLGDHESVTFPRLAAQGRLAAYEIDGYWRAIDSAKDLQEANRELKHLEWAA
ncbi:nucleotidyltransferase family protein [Actinocorallia sp. A-T 12471]|uniref:nucleotidyltransferase family protein n=1 Tax=Actinocorallia sp. A-T 12471 TaxID=3089813 RepID=UPI0029CBC441|nr:nucleotidyltransferase family protein [Actinocorallia sp. A-T 12471]MDX6739911.1 nucleotidyltransferase family protein [Actinocorallia sp. A-T 12471]